jgi:Ser/Thr protein kinase RdoA (MazF antagonist)
MVERVGTPLGDMYASVLGKVDGDELDVEELDGAAAAAWGAALGAFHQAAGLPAMRAQTQRSDPFAALASARAALENPELAVAARTLSTVLTASPVTPLVLGHGDFELDNLRWADGWPTCFDLDESGAMPAAADVASAARDLLGPRPGSPEHPELLTAFLQGYQRTSGQTIEPQELILPRAAFAAQQLLQATEVLDMNSRSVAWLHELDGSLRAHYQVQHEVLLMTADVLV